MVIGFFIIVFVLFFVFKRYVRLILWLSVIILFVGILLFVGIGVINLIDGDNIGFIMFWGIIIILILGVVFVFCVEMLKEGNKGKIKV